MSKHYLAMATTFRDETRFLREWIEYHQMLGVDHFFMLCNDDHKEIGVVEKLLKFYVDAGLVTWKVFGSRRPDWQMEAWYRVINEYGYLCEWVCCTDADAFLYPVNGGDIPTILRRYEQPDIAALAVYLSTFGSSDIEKTPPLQIEAFLRRAPLSARCNWTANYIIRPAMIEVPCQENGYVKPSLGKYIADTSFKAVPTVPTGVKQPGPLDVLRLNHYSVRSREDWKRKTERGWPEIEASWQASKKVVAAHKAIMLDHNDEFDDGMLRYVPQLKERLQ